jgi:hypothetical protein
MKNAVTTAMQAAPTNTKLRSEKAVRAVHEKGGHPGNRQTVEARRTVSSRLSPPSCDSPHLYEVINFNDPRPPARSACRRRGPGGRRGCLRPRVSPPSPVSRIPPTTCGRRGSSQRPRRAAPRRQPAWSVLERRGQPPHRPQVADQRNACAVSDRSPRDAASSRPSSPRPPAPTSIAVSASRQDLEGFTVRMK